MRALRTGFFRQVYSCVAGLMLVPGLAQATAHVVLKSRERMDLFRGAVLSPPRVFREGDSVWIPLPQSQRVHLILSDRDFPQGAWVAAWSSASRRLKGGDFFHLPPGEPGRTLPKSVGGVALWVGGGDRRSEGGPFKDLLPPEPTFQPEKDPELQLGKLKITLELAETDEARALGYMHRRALDPKRGMLFDFFQERDLAFWMGHCWVPIDVVYLDAAGIVLNGYTMQPYLNPSRPGSSPKTWPSRGRARYALEVPGGMIRKASIRPGMQMKLQKP